jgi:hypothetical protein
MQPLNLGEVREALACVVRDADRAGEIIDRIREQIKKAPPRKERFDLNAAINEVMVLAQSVTLRNGVSVQTRLAEGLLPVLGDRIQLQQVLLNLILNAAEAMGSVEVGARELVIRTEQDQTGVLVAVRDSGPGIDPAHLDRVFDAFYTTKSSGTGWGCRYAAPSSMLMGARCGRERMSRAALYFSSCCPALKRANESFSVETPDVRAARQGSQRSPARRPRHVHPADQLSDCFTRHRAAARCASHRVSFRHAVSKLA